MDKYSSLKILLETEQDPENAEAMSKYMKNGFAFYGIAAPERKLLYKNFINTEKRSKIIDWEFLYRCYDDEHREFQYFVYDYLLAMKKYVTFEDIDKIRYFIITKPWWDTTDFLCKVIGDVGLRDPKVKKLMLEWSVDDNIWIRRTAILHQLACKAETDCELLEMIICNCFGSDEFFINKAIGWSLREYSKTSPEWVSDFISRHKDKMNSLSIKEASKYI